jgi:coenzyme PQQ synthesis protein D (PqqD)
MPEPTVEKRIRRGAGVTSAEVHGEAVLLDLRRGKYYSMNRTGAAVWELLSEPRTPSELHDALLERFDVEADALSGDLRDLLDDLRQHALIEESPSATEPPS